MKRIIAAYLSFNKAERYGLAGLLIAIVLLVSIRLLMPFLSKEETPDNFIAAEWKETKEKTWPTPPPSGPIAASTATSTTPAALFVFDPNTLDSDGFRKLGLREKTTSLLLKWRSKGKVFYRKEDFRKLYTLTEAEYERLAPYIIIAASARSNAATKKIHINKADSAALVAINGIGPRLAHRILEYRKKYGAFTSQEQILEVYRFPDSVFARLRKEIIVD